jgi:hypothetical protein
MVEKIVEKDVDNEVDLETEDKSKENDGQHPVDNALDIQNKINEAVKTRVAREKEHQKVLEAQWEEERKTLEEENAFLKKQFQAKIDEVIVDLAPSVRSLISKLPIIDQIKWVNEYAKENETTKPKSIAMPMFNKKEPLDKKGGDIAHIKPDRIA